MTQQRCLGEEDSLANANLCRNMMSVFTVVGTS